MLKHGEMQLSSAKQIMVLGKLFFKVISSSILVLLAAFICNAQIAPGMGANTEDPKKILLATEQALSRVRSVTYDARYEGVGAFATRMSSTVGTIKLVKLETGNPLTAKIAAKGDYYAAGKGEAVPFTAAFTGETVFSLRTNEKILMRKVLADNDPKERDFGFITMRLGVPTDQLIMYEYVLANPLAREMAGEVLEYEGRAIVGGILCHVIYVEFDRRPDGKIRRWRWFIGIKDNLPRKVEQVAVEDKGRYGAYVLTLSNLRVNIPLAPQTFSVQLPKGYKIKDYEPPKRPQPLTVGDSAPEWKLTDPTGKTHALADYRGKVVVLDFWATWCGPCVKTMPDLQALHNKYKERGVEVFGINSWEESNSTAYFQEKGYTYGLLLNGETIAKAYRVSVMPAIFVIGVGGEVIYQTTVPDNNLITIIEQYLKKQGM